MPLIKELVKLESGMPAPDFVGDDIDGNTIRLTDYHQTHLLLVFLRYAGCPWCNLTIHRLALEYPMLVRQNCKVIAFVQSDAEAIKQGIYGQQTVVPPFPIIADPQKKIYAQYGVTSSRKAFAKSLLRLPQWAQAVHKHGFRQGKVDGDVFLVPASFLIAPHTQKVIKASHGSSFYEPEALFEVYQSLIFNEA